MTHLNENGGAESLENTGRVRGLRFAGRWCSEHLMRSVKSTREVNRDGGWPANMLTIQWPDPREKGAVFGSDIKEEVVRHIAPHHLEQGEVEGEGGDVKPFTPRDAVVDLRNSRGVILWHIDPWYSILTRRHHQIVFPRVNFSYPDDVSVGWSLGAAVGVHHVAITVTDLVRSVAWYKESLEFLTPKQETHPDGPGSFEFPASADFSVSVGLHAHLAHEGEAFAETRTGLDHVGFAVADHAALEEWERRSSELGVEHSPLNDRPSYSVGVFRDLGTIQLEFACTP